MPTAGAGGSRAGKANSITDLAAQEDVTDTYPPSAAAAQLLRRTGVSRLLPLTCLAPDIVEAILDGRRPKGLKLADLVRPMPMEWERQRATLMFSSK